MTEGGTDYRFGYDRRGNLTEERRGDALIRQYMYDSAGQMTLGKNVENGEESAYTYNALRMCVGNVQKLASADGSRNREMQYVPDFLSVTENELMAYETGAGSIRTVFGHGYQRLVQSAAVGKTFFQSDFYGSPLFAADRQGEVQQYAERGIWGNLKDGTEILPGLEENLRFTSYRYDPVLGKHFAHARFYDDANGRMLALDPVRRDLNGYRYCDNDPVDYADPTGEVLNIIGGAVLGGVFGGAGGLISSAVSQKLSGEKVNWRKAWGAAANGAITGAVQGGLVASGAGIPVTLASNFLAGAAGSAAEQYISEGKVDARKSITSGLTNAVSNAIYGTKPLKSVGGAFLRGAGAGAATAGINYISDLIGQKPGWEGIDAGLLTGMAGKLISPYGGAMRNPKRGCGSVSPFVSGFGYSSAKGYRYDVPKAGGVSRKEKKKFSLKEFLKETAVGGITGGVASAGFYGAGKGIERLKDGFRNLGRNSNDWYSPLSLNLGEADDASINAAMKIAGPSTAEEFKVFGHGNPNGIQYKGQVLNADKVAHLIRNSPRYTGGKQIVKLYACDTGRTSDGFAQQLANNLGVMVEAPNRKLFPTVTGEFVIADKISWLKNLYTWFMGSIQA